MNNQIGLGGAGDILEPIMRYIESVKLKPCISPGKRIEPLRPAPYEIIEPMTRRTPSSSPRPTRTCNK